jgi:hypothetical protein
MRKNLELAVILILSLLGVSSCTPSAPYEITSPCVSIDSDNPYAHNPCIRKPWNRDLA